MTDNYNKLISLLKELFQLDQTDLDFGIYRIMNQKSEEVTAFLEKDLIPQIRKTLGELSSGERDQIEEDLKKAEQTVKDMGMDPALSPKVQALRKKLKDETDPVTLENDIFSHLYNFFRRYYHQGDFLSMRRYKEGVYAIPYSGEEVKLHWANADQYYIKTTEYFNNYTFKLQSGNKVNFKIRNAETEQDNKKEASGKERKFVLCETDFVEIDGDNINIYFEYKPDSSRKSQDTINEENVEKILTSIIKNKADIRILQGLKTAAPTEKNPNRTLLEKHLKKYTARNTFDYFIHKNLGGFLRRELDFYIKNEVMHLDDVENQSMEHVREYMAKIKAIRKVAHKIIRFLEQLENFQKKMWLKKKFVVETNYCITLDRVPEDLYPAIAGNKEQVDEWIKLFAIDEIQGDMLKKSFSNGVDEEFLKQNLCLVLDTKFFDDEFRDRLLKSIDNIDENLDGLLIHSENFQALNLLQERYREQVKCIYIDPPYNTSASEILYKNSYKHSSWMSFLNDRIVLSLSLMNYSSLLEIAIDDAENLQLLSILYRIFNESNYVSTICIQHNPRGRADALHISPSHEYLYLFSKDYSNLVTNQLIQSADELKEKYPKKDAETPYRELPFKRSGSNSRRVDRPNLYYPIYYSAETNKLSLDCLNESWIEILPLDSNNEERVWRWGKEKASSSFDSEFIVKKTQNNSYSLCVKDRIKETIKPKTFWYGAKFDASSYGTMLLKDYFGFTCFDYPKSINSVNDALHIGSNDDSLILDYFAGSGTTAHAVINLNREDGGSRKFILVEMGDYFDTVLKPRIQKVIYSKDWKDGKPVSREGSSHCFKYLRLESYEDTLNNLELKRTDVMEKALNEGGMSPTAREEYLLGYMLDIEAEGSKSLLNVHSFRNPFDYRLKITRNNETVETKIDLIETFNYLTGLKVKAREKIRGVTAIKGENLKGEKILVLWRNIDETDRDALDEWFRKQNYSTRDFEFSIIYVNGDNNLENFRRDDETWKVRLIEQEFKKLMFDVRDV